MVQLAEKRRKEGVVAKAQEMQDTLQIAAEQKKAIAAAASAQEVAMKAREGKKLPSYGKEAEEEEAWTHNPRQHS